MVRRRDQEIDKEHRRKRKLLKRRYKRPELKDDEEPGLKVVDTLVALPIAWDPDQHPDVPPEAQNLLLYFDPGGSRSGPSKQWTPDRLTQLFDCVRKAKKKYSLRTDREALQKLVEECEEWRAPKNHWGNWTRHLERQLRHAKEFRRLLAKAHRDLRRARSEVLGRKIK
jgi:hypothetical protein